MAGRKTCSQIIILPKFFTPFRTQFLPEDGLPVHYNSGTESPSPSAVQNRRADVARNTLLTGGPVREDLARLLLLPFLLLLPVDFMTAPGADAPPIKGRRSGSGRRLPVARSENSPGLR